MRVRIIGADTPVGLSLVEDLTPRGTECVGLAKADCRWKRELQARGRLSARAITLPRWRLASALWQRTWKEGKLSAAVSLMDRITR